MSYQETRHLSPHNDFQRHSPLMARIQSERENYSEMDEIEEDLEQANEQLEQSINRQNLADQQLQDLETKLNASKVEYAELFNKFEHLQQSQGTRNKINFADFERSKILF